LLRQPVAETRAGEERVVARVGGDEVDGETLEDLTVGTLPALLDIRSTDGGGIQMAEEPVRGAELRHRALVRQARRLAGGDWRGGRRRCASKLAEPAAEKLPGTVALPADPEALPTGGG